MDNRDERIEHHAETNAPVDAGDSAREDWQEPKLTFVEPTLTHHGPLTAVTGQFFGAFSPPSTS